MKYLTRCHSRIKWIRRDRGLFLGVLQIKLETRTSKYHAGRRVASDRLKHYETTGEHCRRYRDAQAWKEDAHAVRCQTPWKNPKRRCQLAFCCCVISPNRRNKKEAPKALIGPPCKRTGSGWGYLKTIQKRWLTYVLATLQDIRKSFCALIRRQTIQMV